MHCLSLFRFIRIIIQAFLGMVEWTPLYLPLMSSVCLHAGCGGGLEDRHAAIISRAVELGMDVVEDIRFLWLAAESLEAPLPAGWEQRHDAFGQPYFLEVTSLPLLPTHRCQSSREHPASEEYRKRFFALKLQEVGYRQLMLSRVSSTHITDALACMHESEARRLEALFERHDRDKVSECE